MQLKFSPRLRKVAMLAPVLLAANMAFAQQSTATTEADDAGPGVTQQDIARLKQQLADAPQISEPVRKEIGALLDKAALGLEEAEGFKTQTAALQKDLEQAGKPVPPPTPANDAPVEALDKLSSDQLRAELTKADQQAGEARDALQAVSVEIEHRAKRRQEIPADLVKTREQLASTEEALQAGAADDSPLLAEAKRVLYLARAYSLRRQLVFFAQETRTYEATARRIIAQRDVAQKNLQVADSRLQKISQLAAALQKRQAEQQAKEARRAAINAHPALAEATARNAELAERNQALVEKEARFQQELDQVDEQSEAINKRLDDVIQRAEEAQGSPLIGAMLRSEQDQLPELEALRRRIRNRPAIISELRLDKFEWQNQRNAVSPVDAALEQAVRQYEARTDAALPKEIVQELRRALEARADILADLISNADDSIACLAELDTAESQVIATTERLSNFIAEHVFWVPSAPTLSVRELRYTLDYWRNGAARLDDLEQLGHSLLTDAKQQPGMWGLVALLALVLTVGRLRVKRVLFATGEAASKPTCTVFRPTFKAALATLFLATPTSLLIGFIGWRLTLDGAGLSYAAGRGVLFFAVTYWGFNVVRHACRAGGIGAQHFSWDPKCLEAVRRSIRFVQVIALPLLAIAVGVESGHDEAAIHAIGRVSLIMALLAFSGIGLILRPLGPALAAMAVGAGRPWAARPAMLMGPLLAVCLLALAAASAFGLHYTAVQLTRRALLTAAAVALCLAARALLMRWLLMAYRRVAMRRAREKRQALLEAKENSAIENPAIEIEQQVSLSSINQQARRLVNAGFGAALIGALLLVWGDVLPALGVFDQVNLWQSGFTSPDETIVWVTLTDLFLAFGVFVITLYAARNLPGLLEFSLFQKLPLDAGARYAASTVSCYLITLIGFLLGMRLLGVGWHSVQWLVAAMTVGLGFGLQEIFANFVSGIILLFERPVRPGDVVTIGEVSGKVTKIRIRATTIQDWDNKELIVPNREFITGNLINWTLSSRVLRLVIKVGVAYGSDTGLVRKLLYKIAAEEPNVMETPEPFVMFGEFGDSTLNFELRVFVNDVALLLETKDNLHMAIDKTFREQNIEIAFPQRDLHIRSIPEALGALATNHVDSQSHEDPTLRESQAFH